MDYTEIRRIWYNKFDACCEMVKLLKDKELVFLDKNPTKEYTEKRPTFRYNKCHHTNYMKLHFDAFHFLETETYNLYYSLADLKNLPIMPYKPEYRKKAMEELNANFDNYLVGYDFLMDIDAQDSAHIMDAWNTAKFLKSEVFDKLKLPYSLIPTNNKGFHFKIRYHYLPHTQKIKLLVKTLNKVAYNIAGIYNLPQIDYSIIDFRRIALLPFSYNKGYVAIPLSDEEFEVYDRERYLAERWLSVNLANRGMKERTFNLSDTELRLNVKKFIKEYR